MARWIMLAGLGIFALGVIIHFAPWVFNWFGKLPGDIRSESDRGIIFVPITSMIIVSVIITILINLFKR